MSTPSFFDCLYRNRAKRWWVISLGLAILTIAWMANLQTINTCLQQTPGQSDIVDLELSGLHGTTASMMFEWETQILCHGVTRSAKDVAKISISRDWGFIFVYVAFGIALVGAAGRSCSWTRRWRHFAAVVVIAAGIADIMENTLLLSFALNADEVNTGMATLAAIAAVSKFTLLGLVALAVGLRLFLCLYRCRGTA